MDPLSLLRRDEKWFLGGGKGAIYAPPFPKHLLVPGYWDECYFADVRLSRLFSILLLNAAGRPIRLKSEIQEWRPDRLIISHSAPGYEITERRCVTEGNAWVSELELVTAEGGVNAFLWSLPELRAPGTGTPWQSISAPEVLDDRVRMRIDTAWPSELEPDRTAVEKENLAGTSQVDMLPPMGVHLALGSSCSRASWTINLAQRHEDAPLWETSILPQKLRNGRLPGDQKVFVGPEPHEGLLHVVQHYELRQGDKVTFACGSGLDAAAADASLDDAINPGALERSERDWLAFFASVPQFESSDPYLTAAYWYRWYGLRLNTVEIEGLPVLTEGSTGEGRGSREEDATRAGFSSPSPPVFSPYVTEGIGFFRNFITYSAQAHLREVAWMHDPSLATGIVENLGKVQREDGSFPGHNYSCRPPRDFYHADFATGIRHLMALHRWTPVEAVATLYRYGKYLANVRRAEDPSLVGVLILDQNETGQEYMSRYQVASDQADQWGSFEIIGVETTLYGRRLAQVLFDLIDEDDADLVEPEAFNFQRLLQIDHLYDDAAHVYKDLLMSGERSSAVPSACLYPLADLDPVQGKGEAMECAYRWLLNPEGFWRPKGFPATWFKDETYSSDGEWKEKRLNCPWNGRSWPMANSHIVDALCGVARQAGTQELREKAGEGLMKAIRLMFHDDDPSRPNSYEHYDPETGTPALYRGYDDYMHSWIVDLIIRHAVGVQPGSDEVDPLPIDTDWIECRDIPHPRGRMSVRIERGKPPKVEITEAAVC